MGSELADFLKTIRRRWWVAVLALVIVPAAAVYYSERQPKRYQASADVLLSRQNLAATISGIPDYSYYDPSVAQTQAELATTLPVAERTLRALHVRPAVMSPAALLGAVSVTPRTDTDLLSFSVSDGDPARAARLVNEYAHQYTLYRRDLDTASLRSALADVQRRLDQLATQSGTSSAAYRDLVGRQQQLQTLEVLQNSNASVVRTATGAVQTAPKTYRNGVVGLALGLILGLGLALVWDALDTRVRSAEDISHHLGLPLLARVADPSRRLQRGGKLVMATNPKAAGAESFRVLRTNFDFANLERRAKVVMVTSAVEREGKSTTVANLALAFVRTGRRVLLVDLDLRRPSLDKLFGFRGREGLTNVLLGELTLDEAIKYMSVEHESTPALASVNGNGTSENGDGSNGSGHIEGVLRLLLSGPSPLDAGEVTASHRLGRILDELAARPDLDLVLVDAPPLLHVGDAMTLSARVDALFVVTRLKVLKRPMLKELRRVLDRCPTAKLGFVLTGARFEEGYGYGGYSYASKKVERLEERTPA